MSELASWVVHEFAGEWKMWIESRILGFLLVLTQQTLLEGFAGLENHFWIPVSSSEGPSNPLSTIKSSSCKRTCSEVSYEQPIQHTQLRSWLPNKTLLYL